MQPYLFDESGYIEALRKKKPQHTLSRQHVNRDCKKKNRDVAIGEANAVKQDVNVTKLPRLMHKR